MHSYSDTFMFHRAIQCCVLRVNYLIKYLISHILKKYLCFAYACGSGAIVWPSTRIVLASDVDWLWTKFRAIFTRNSKFHIRICCQLRDSVTPASVFFFVPSPLHIKTVLNIKIYLQMQNELICTFFQFTGYQHETWIFRYHLCFQC